MYGIGISEIAAVFLILLLFFKPEDLIKLFRKAGQWSGKINKIQMELKDIIEIDDKDSKTNESFGFDLKENNKENNL